MIEDNSLAGADPDRARSVVSPRTIRSVLSEAIVALSFWTAVCLPVLLAGLLFAGIETPMRAGAFLVLSVLEVVALVIGHSYGLG